MVSPKDQEKHDEQSVDILETVHHNTAPIDIDHEAEKLLVRKVDRYVIPVVMITYLLCFLGTYCSPV